jgi:DNA primase
MNVEQAKSIRIDEFLENLGYVCDKETGGRKWFRFREEKTASFVVSKDGGAFFDHGTGEHGNIIDVAKAAAKTDSVSEALKFIENTVGSNYSFTIRQTLPVQPTEPYYSIAYDAEFSIYK